MRSADGTWGYAEGRAGRLEPTAWAAIALSGSSSPPVADEVLRSWPSAQGLYHESRTTPVNVTFNGLALLALLASGRPGAASTALLRALLAKSGRTLPDSPVSRQNNALRGWAWVDDSFSFVEPTSTCLLAIKRAHRLGLSDPAMAGRVDEAERLLVDRACEGGGWNYGNSNVFGRSLPPYVPTTALALLALQDRPALPAVETGLERLRRLALTEGSTLALGLTALCLSVFDWDVTPLLDQLETMLERRRVPENVASLAIAAYALSVTDHGASAIRI
ncbi:MAG: hypothetical protein U0Q12_08875 [Vicinamibacterales bacterium]